MWVLYGNLPFDNGVEDPDVIRHMTEADQDNPDVALWIKTNVKYDIPLLVNLYDEAMQNYTEIKNVRLEEEETNKTVTRLVAHLNKDMKSMVFEVFGGEIESSPSVIQDIVRQLDELKRRMVSVFNMTDKEVKFNDVVIHECDDSTTVFAKAFPRMGKRKLL